MYKINADSICALINGNYLNNYFIQYKYMYILFNILLDLLK